MKIADRMFADSRLAMNPYSPASNPNLWRAVALSLALHAMLLASGLWLPKSRSPAAHPKDLLRVKIADPVIPAPETQPVVSQPELRMPEDTPRKAVTTPARKTMPREVRSAKPPPPPPRLSRPGPAPGRAEIAAGPPMIAGEAARKAGEQIARQLFYPPEAIERGLEGEALVLLFLDASGNVIAARIEASSGHALLDEAAVRAARTLRSLPSNAPREAVLPVRFRLR